MKRFTKLAVLAVGILGLVATSAPPAQATTVQGAVFVGFVTLSGPLSYPINPTAPDQGLTLQPADLPPEQHCALPLGLPTDAVPLTNCHLDWGGHTRTVTNIASTSCVGAAVNVNKPGKTPVTTGACAFSETTNTLTGGNHVHGYCGLSGGQVRVTYVGPDGNPYVLDIHFNGLGGTLFLTGHAYKAGVRQRGLVVGVTLAIPPLPPAQGCAQSQASTFTLVGAVAAAGLN